MILRIIIRKGISPDLLYRCWIILEFYDLIIFFFFFLHKQFVHKLITTNLGNLSVLRTDTDLSELFPDFCWIYQFLSFQILDNLYRLLSYETFFFVESTLSDAVFLFGSSSPCFKWKWWYPPMFILLQRCILLFIHYLHSLWRLITYNNDRKQLWPIMHLVLLI